MGRVSALFLSCIMTQASPRQLEGKAVDVSWLIPTSVTPVFCFKTRLKSLPFLVAFRRIYLFLPLAQAAAGPVWEHWNNLSRISKFTLISRPRSYTMVDWHRDPSGQAVTHGNKITTNKQNMLGVNMTNTHNNI